MHIGIRTCIQIVRVVVWSIVRLLFSCRRQHVISSLASRWNSSIVVTQRGSRLSLHFHNPSNDVQSELDLNRLNYPCLEYIQLMLVSLLFQRSSLSEKNILFIGLGGGTLARSLRLLYPSAWITVVEVDSVVIEVAQKYFHFREDVRMRVIEADGRCFLEQQCPSIRYHLIVVDAYDQLSGMPFHLKTREFFVQLKDRLDPDEGLFIINLVCIYRSYFNVRSTLESVFERDNLIRFRSSDLVNMIVVGSPSRLSSPSIEHRMNFEREMKEKLSIDVCQLLRRQQTPAFESNQPTRIYHDDTQINEIDEELSIEQFVHIV